MKYSQSALELRPSNMSIFSFSLTILLFIFSLRFISSFFSSLYLFNPSLSPSSHSLFFLSLPFSPPLFSLYLSLYPLPPHTQHARPLVEGRQMVPDSNWLNLNE